MVKQAGIPEIIGHLAWLLRPEYQVTDWEQARTKALLIYNAAAMLLWRFVSAREEVGTTIDANKRDQAASVIADLVTASRKAASDLDTHRRQDFWAVLKELDETVQPLLTQLPTYFGFTPPVPARDASLEVAPDIRGLVREALEQESPQSEAPLAEQGADAAITEGLALMAWYTGEGGRDRSTEDRHALVQMAAGYIKTAADLKAEESQSASRPLLNRLVDSVVDDLQATA